ncbi:unnamed protein product, partial [Rhizoctonia solani]
FVKSTELYKVLRDFGSNLLVVEGEEWRRQRRIAAPAFSDRNNRLVWDTTKRFVDKATDSWELKKPTIIHDVRKDFTSPISLCIIAKAAFGQDISVETDITPTGHKLTFGDALSMAAKTLHLPLVLPSWAWELRESWSKAKQAHDELRVY